MSFLDHLEELRWHIIRSLLAIFVFATIAFLAKQIVFDRIILAPKTPEFWTNRMLCRLSEAFNMPKLCINSKPFDLQSIYLSGQFMAHIKISIISGLILAFPYVFYEFCSFFEEFFCFRVYYEVQESFPVYGFLVFEAVPFFW